MDVVLVPWWSLEETGVGAPGCFCRRKIFLNLFSRPKKMHRLLFRAPIAKTPCFIPSEGAFLTRTANSLSRFGREFGDVDRGVAV